MVLHRQSHHMECLLRVVSMITPLLLSQAMGMLKILDVDTICCV
jgi:hypothetical protein